MADRRTTAADLMRALELDIRVAKARRLFNDLDRPFIFERPAGLTRRAARHAYLAALGRHRRVMLRRLCQHLDLPPDSPLSSLQMATLLMTVLRTYVPAFGDGEEVPPKRAPGRPPTALTDQQKAAIEQGVKAGRSVRSTCLTLAKRDRRAADALAAAYRRATKMT